MSTIPINDMLFFTNLATNHCSYCRFIQVKLLLKRQATQDRQTDRQTDRFGSVTVLTNLWTLNCQFIQVKLLLKRQATQDRQTDRQTVAICDTGSLMNSNQENIVLYSINYCLHFEGEGAPGFPRPLLQKHVLNNVNESSFIFIRKTVVQHNSRTDNHAHKKRQSK